MTAWAALLLSLPVSALASGGIPKTLGVQLSLLPAYVAAKGDTWKCLDGSKTIPWKKVNDDFCDCADGSDEPGTSACPNTLFYCKNEGHIGATIPSSRVNDGLCEPSCCDGSDERPGLCPNKCKEINAEFSKKFEAEQKKRKTGAKIRSTYVAFAHKEKKRLEDQLVDLNRSIETKEIEVARLKDLADRTESLSQAELEEKKKSPLFSSLERHRGALAGLKREYKKVLEKEKALGEILDNLRSKYNPNYQDMAVLEAVRGWEQIANLPHINDVGKDDQVETEGTSEESGEEEDDASAVYEPEEELPEGEWPKEDLTWKLDNLLKEDATRLLIEHDEFAAGHAEPSLIHDLGNYLPDSLLNQYEDMKSTLLGWLEKFNVVQRRPDAGAQSSKAKQMYDDAESDLRQAKQNRLEVETQISDIFKASGYGAQGEWKKLDGTCLDTVVGDYTYEVCLFKEAQQKPTNGGMSFNLGKFSHWNTEALEGTPAYYSKQYYKQGARCWNGPERSVVLLLECGLENAINDVQELEKCEYQFKGTTPALCLPLEATNGHERDEL